MTAISLPRVKRRRRRPRKPTPREIRAFLWVGLGLIFIALLLVSWIPDDIAQGDVSSLAWDSFGVVAWIANFILHWPIVRGYLDDMWKDDE